MKLAETKTLEGRVLVGGASISYISLFAALVAVFALIPFSVLVAAGGGAFPMSEAIYPLCGIIMGPIAGGLAAAIGGIIGMLIAPHTAWLGLATFAIGTMNAVIAGLVASNRWKTAGGLLLALYIMAVGIAAYLWIPLGTFMLFFPFTLYYILALILLLIPPIRNKMRTYLKSGNPARVFVGVAYMSWIGTWTGHAVANIGFNSAFNPPPILYSTLFIWLTPMERFTIAMLAALIGSALIVVLRKMRTPKPKYAAW